MLTLNLTPIFIARGIEKPYSFLTKAGFSPHAANFLVNNKSRVFRLDHIERLCHTLNCEPNDILMWTPDKNIAYPDNYPLKNLIQTDNNQNILETLTKLPYKELKQKAIEINNLDNKK